MNIGDEVILITKKHGISENNPYYKTYPNVIGIIVNEYIGDTFPIEVEWSNGYSNSYQNSNLKLQNDLDKFIKLLI